MVGQATAFRGRLMPRKVREGLTTLGLTSLTLLVLTLFLIPMVYGIVTSLKTDSQFAKIGAPWWPASERKFTYEGKDYEVYLVPLDGEIKKLALYQKGRQSSWFVDPENPEAGPFEWEGQWRQLERDWEFDPQWSNFVRAWNTINFPLLLRNTVMYASITTIGAVLSAALVAYGFARFRIPAKNVGSSGIHVVDKVKGHLDA
jgi:multiple sugar transport system permease protein